MEFHFIYISFHAPKNESLKSLELESDIFYQNLGLRLA